MRKVYIRGLVRTANTVRRELARPISTSHKEELRRWVVNSLDQVGRILASHGARVESLPAPTQRAYRFLAGLNFDAVVSAETAETGPAPRSGDVTLTGLKSYWDRVLAELACPISVERAATLHRSLRLTLENVEDDMQKHDLQPGDLTKLSAMIRGWLAFFSQRENFDVYCAAVARARPDFETAIQRTEQFRIPALVQFRPLPGLYRIQGDGKGTRIALATPMICFSEGLLSSLAEAALNGGSRQPALEATLSEEYQAIQAELEALIGVAEHTSGVYHDLETSFRRVNDQYFGGALPRPRLNWSRAFTGRRFGHYDPLHDAVIISSTLDRADVPAFVLDSVMHHELLHKKLGVNWRDGRREAHTPEFKEHERRFEQYAEADAMLGKLARHP